MISKSFLPWRATLAFWLLLALFGFTNDARAYRLEVVHAFHKQDDPGGGTTPLMADRAGNLFGSSYSSIFKITPDNKETVLYLFSSAVQPGQLLEDAAGNLYGNASQYRNAQDFPYGAAFKLSPNGTLTILHMFCSRERCRDGWWPVGALTKHGKGFYGVTAVGGGGNGCKAYGCGTVFKLSANGNETVVHEFCAGCSKKLVDDGEEPTGSLVADAAGNLYGQTMFGGIGSCTSYETGTSGCGTIFRIGADGSETVLYKFKDKSDGAYPIGDLISDKEGNLYGVTQSGGKYGSGTIFEVTTDGKLTVLHSIGADINAAVFGGVTRDAAGNLYGVTFTGGKFDNGSIYQVAPDGSAEVIHSFGHHRNPLSELLIKNGTLYGSAGGIQGGDNIIYALAHH